jgi:hypothetical protein
MHIVIRTIEAFAGPRERAEFARDLGVPPQTVHDWIGSENIPHWRRPAIIDLARKRNLSLEPEIAAFLASSVPGKQWDWKAAA